MTDDDWDAVRALKRDELKMRETDWLLLLFLLKDRIDGICMTPDPIDDWWTSRERDLWDRLTNYCRDNKLIDK